jgi:hypothetical protein
LNIGTGGAALAQVTIAALMTNKPAHLPVNIFMIDPG